MQFTYNNILHFNCHNNLNQNKSFRLAIEGMVEDLINADADINAADNSGKTALHWAAAVNNVDAVNVLLVHGANRDAQDDKVS